MGFSLVAYNESVDASAADQNVAAAVDQHVTTDGDDILVPGFAPNLAAVLYMGATAVRAQVTSPSLRRHTQLDVQPVNTNTEPLAPTPYLYMWDRPEALEEGEGLRTVVTNGAAEQSTLGIWLQGERVTLPEGPIQTVRATSATTLTAEVWSLCTLTLTQQLEAGRYAIVGMRMQGASARLARLVIPGSEFRPGCIAYDAAGDVEDQRFRRGGLGQSWGEFDHRFIPQVEVLADAADTAQTVWIDIIKIA